MRELDSRHARIVMPFDGGQLQRVLILPNNGIEWSFANYCSGVVKSAACFPTSLLLTLLRRNAKLIRGRWIVDEVGSSLRLGFQHTMDSRKLTACEFASTCLAVATEVQEFDDFMRMLAT